MDRWIPLLLVVIVALALYPALSGQVVYLGVDLPAALAPWANESPSIPSAGNATVGDTVDIHALRAYFWNNVKAGEVTAWNPLLSAGVPSFLEAVSPFAALSYGLTPEWYAPGLLMALKLSVAAVGVFYLLRKLGVTAEPAGIAGLAYAFSGFFGAWPMWPHTEVAALVPWLFLTAMGLAHNPGPRSAAGLGMATGLAILSGFPSVMLYGVYAGAIWFLVAAVVSDRSQPLRAIAGRWIRRIGWGWMAALCAAFIGAIWLLPFSQLYQTIDTSYRIQAPGAHLSARFLITTVLPSAFGSHHGAVKWWAGEANWPEASTFVGAGTLVLSMLALGIRDASKRLLTYAVTLVVIVGLFMVVIFAGGTPTEWFQQLPFMDVNAVGRSRVIVNFGLALLAGIGLEAWRRSVAPDEVRQRLVVGMVLASALLGVVVYSIWGHIATYSEDLVELGLVSSTRTSVAIAAGVVVIVSALLIAGRLLSERWRTVVVLIVGLIVFAEVGLVLEPVNPTVARDAYLPETATHESLASADERWTTMASNKTMVPNTNVLFGIADARGHVFHPPGYRRLVEEFDPGAFAGGTPTNAWLAEGLDITDRALDQLRVKYWVDDHRIPVVASEMVVHRPTGASLDPPLSFDLEPTTELRGVSLLPMSIDVASGASVTLRVVGADGQILSVATRPVWQMWSNGWVQFPVADGKAFAGTEVSVQIEVDGPPDSIVFAARRGQPLVPAVRLFYQTEPDGLGLVSAGSAAVYERANAEPLVTVHTRAFQFPASFAPSAMRLTASDAAILIEPLGRPLTAELARVGRLEAAPDSVTATVWSDGSALVVLRQNPFPGWVARVDDQVVPIREAEVAFMAVEVPAGVHTVEFSYRPASFRGGLLITAFGLLLAAMLAWLGRRYPYDNESDTSGLTPDPQQ